MAIFKSKYKEHRIILEPSKKVRIGDGFELKKGIDVKFIDGYYRTNDKDMIAILKELSKKYPIEEISEKQQEAELKARKPKVK